MTRLAVVVGLAALLATGAGPKAQTRQSVSSRGTSGDRVMSPAVVASWTGTATPDGKFGLDLLVLWRGTPGWFLGGQGHGSSSGGSTSGVTGMSIHYGDVMLSVSYDPATRTARVQDHDIKLLDDNVVLVDEVDRPDALKIVGTKKVERDMEDGRRIDLVIRRSPELHPFMRCDVQLPDPKSQPLMDLLCSQIIPK